MRKFMVNLAFDGDDTQIIIDALRSSKGDRAATNRERHLADKIEREMAADRKSYDAQVAAADSLAAYRESRAVNHTLTLRQAGALASVRAGKGPRWYPERRTRGDEVYWRWVIGRSIGGAISRMIETLTEEGLLTDRRELTPAGLARLEAWEIENPGKVPAVGEEVR